MKTAIGILSAFLLIILLISMFNGNRPQQLTETHKITGSTVEKPFHTFKKTGNELCIQEGKPVIRMYSTTWCLHCKWIKDTFDRVAKEYADKGKIIAHHWELDAEDDILTEEKEDKVPDSEMEIFRKFDPSGGVPLFVFGCKYYRLGNGYEREENGLALEEKEFRNAIENIVSEAGGK